MRIYLAVNGIEIGVDEEDLGEFTVGLTSGNSKMDNSMDEQSEQKTKQEMQEYEKSLAQLIAHIDQQIPLKEEEQVLILYHLKTPEMVIQFMDWIESRLSDTDEIQATKEEILRAAVQISKQADREYV